MPRLKKRLILPPEEVIGTIETLRRRIRERFGEGDLALVCGQLLEIAKLDMGRASALGRSYIFLRLFVFVALCLVAAMVLSILVPFFSATGSTSANAELAVSLIGLTGTITVSMLTLEQRLKRRRALTALHELRSIVHVIDMRQLTKDPSKFIIGSNTASSPLLELNEFEMTRYLEYCTEMLSLASKVAVVFGQTLNDSPVAEVVSDIEYVSTGLSQKIWQKISILQDLREADVTAAALSMAGDKPAGP